MFTSSINFEALQGLVTGKDPVCGMDVDATKAAAVSSHLGQTYYFCAPACKQAFDAEPAKYLPKN